MKHFHAFDHIRYISEQCYMQPRDAEKKMRTTFDSISKFQNKLWTRLTLARLSNKDVGTNEVIKYAINQAKQSKKLTTLLKRPLLPSAPVMTA